jgi:DNA-3-methyladenine glycosylase I
MSRCTWAGDDPLYIAYHDEQWGVPVHDDRLWFEMLILEGAQAGLSWLTVLRKREHYRKVYDNWDVEAIAAYDDDKIVALLQDPGIIRNRLKVNASVKNARAFLQVQAEFGSFDTYMWRFVDGKHIINHWPTLAEVPAQTPLSQTMSKDLKKRGFSFVGPTICYALMQSCGMVNDHTTDCFRHAEVSELYQK